jgi:hypothetical protein
MDATVLVRVVVGDFRVRNDRVRLPDTALVSTLKRASPSRDAGKQIGLGMTQQVAEK